MKVRILEIDSRCVAGRTGVKFWASSGVGWASWRGQTEPEIGRLYDVELDLDGEICDYKPRTTTDYHQAFAATHQGMVLYGVLESVDPDGMGFLRFAPDCLMMIQTCPRWNIPGLHVELNVRPGELDMTPIGG